MALPKVLCVGLMCYDTVNHVDHYPEEDEDIRAKHQTVQSGGNCTNTAKVLALLGRQCEFLGTLGTGMEASHGIKEMDALGITHSACPVFAQYRTSASYITLNMSNGSRTIVHYRNIPELAYEDFLKVDITEFGWIHFEGRNPTESIKMVKHIRDTNEQNPTNRITLSIEIEKTKPELLDLIPLPDLLIVSKELAKFCGYSDKMEAVTKLRSKAKKDAIIVCPWGEEGAAASDRHGNVYSSPAYPPPEILDTLGAGDTFNAAFIHRTLAGHTIQESLDYACKVAGTKCGMVGYGGLECFRTRDRHS